MRFSSCLWTFGNATLLAKIAFESRGMAHIRWGRLNGAAIFVAQPTMISKLEPFCPLLIRRMLSGRPGRLSTQMLQFQQRSRRDDSGPLSAQEASTFREPSPARGPLLGVHCKMRRRPSSATSTALGFPASSDDEPGRICTPFGKWRLARMS